MTNLRKIQFSLLALLIAFVASEAAAFGWGWKWGCLALALWALAAWPLLLAWDVMRQVVRELVKKPAAEAVEEVRSARETSGKID